MMRFLILLFILNNCCVSYGRTLELAHLDLKIADNIKIEQDCFLKQIKPSVDDINSQAIIAIAPTGGSKVTPFKQLNLDGLVIIDWAKPGRPNDILKAFSDPDQVKKLSFAVQQGLTNGSMDSSAVMSVPLSAQILARLNYELGATNIVMSYWLEKKDRLSLEHNNITIDENLWAHGQVIDTDPVLVTAYSFDMKSGRKILIVLSSLITSDLNQTRSPMPFEHLNNLSSIPYTWLYHSADGLMFFSNKQENGLQLASKKLLDIIRPGGGVILDYPTLDYYVNGCLDYDGITSMCGRKNLESYGLNLLQNIVIKSPFVFGYCGVSEDNNDTVKIFRKPGLNISVNTTNQLFDFSRFVQVGENYQIVFASVIPNESANS